VARERLRSAAPISLSETVTSRPDRCRMESTRGVSASGFPALTCALKPRTSSQSGTSRLHGLLISSPKGAAFVFRPPMLAHADFETGEAVTRSFLVLAVLKKFDAVLPPRRNPLLLRRLYVRDRWRLRCGGSLRCRRWLGSRRRSLLRWGSRRRRSPLRWGVQRWSRLRRVPELYPHGCRTCRTCPRGNRRHRRGRHGRRGWPRERGRARRYGRPDGWLHDSCFGSVIHQEIRGTVCRVVSAGCRGRVHPGTGSED